MSDLFLRHDRVPLDMEPLLRPQRIATRRLGAVEISGTAAARALEQSSRFAISPNWLIYLPPAEMRAEIGTGDLWLHEALRPLASSQAHLAFRPSAGSLAYILVCRDMDVARRRFAATGDEECGAAWTSTGRAVFADQVLRSDLVLQLRRSVEAAGLWDLLGTDWLLVEAEVSRWSDEDRARRLRPLLAAQAERHLSSVAAQAALAIAGNAADALRRKIESRGAKAHAQLARSRRHLARSTSLTPLRIVAGEGKIWADTGDDWQADMRARLQPDPGLAAGGSLWQVLDLRDPARCERVASLIDDHSDLVIELRAPELRPSLRLSKHLKIQGRHPDLSLWPMCSADFRAQHALGIEALERFIEGWPAIHVHECLLGIFALSP